MHGGYLAIETNSSLPGLVRLVESACVPSLSAGLDDKRGVRIRYAAHFDDVNAGHMHAHSALRRCLVDIDAGLYRSDVITAVAAVDASDLNHRLSYIDPDLARDPSLAEATSARRRLHRLSDRAWYAVGLAAAMILLIRLLLGI
jgi:hypothetical protein